jgi:S-adenosylmethionine:tRNA ribosyltransferase-isomerase
VPVGANWQSAKAFRNAVRQSMSLNTADYDYSLPEDLIARYPAVRRDESRLMLLDRAAGRITHLTFSDFVSRVHPDELLVLNDTKVIPARIRFPDRNSEILLVDQINELTWRCLVRPGKWFSIGRKIDIPGLKGLVTEIVEDGDRIIRLDAPIDFSRIGELPLPPYIGRDAEGLDSDRYQTIYASRAGAIAAPTAGLHFTPSILERLNHAFVTLHVGIGTFKPVKTEVVTDHRMHREEFEVQMDAAARINQAARILAVGTTTVRTLESLMRSKGKISAGRGSTDIFIYPPFEFQRVNCMLTNFHLPKSTLLMLVAAFAGKDFMLEAYQEAIREKYRFFSYGDCMLIR